MDFEKQLRVLQAAKGDPAKLALASVEIAYSELPEDEQAVLRKCLEAAAVPHWCDENILAALLDTSVRDSAHRLAQLSHLNIIEPFPARGTGAMNVHEANRFAIRERLAEEDKPRFLKLSRLMAEHFANDFTASGRIEWVYHLICYDPERGATELEKIDRDWSNARPEDRLGLAVALGELERTQLLQGRARVWVSLYIAWTRSFRGETARLEQVARDVLKAAQSTGDPCAEASAYGLLGEVLRTRGKISEAEKAYKKYLNILVRLTEQERGNTGYQRDLAVAHSYVADGRKAQGNLEEARKHYQQSLGILLRLVEQDPNNADWQVQLAAIYNSVGSVLMAQDKLDEADKEFQNSLKVTQPLVEHDPNNGDWQSGLNSTYTYIGAVLDAKGEYEKSRAAYEKGLGIMRRLVEQDPSNADWQRKLATDYCLYGNSEQSLRRLEEAHQAYDQYLALMLRLSEQEPGNTDLERDLAIAYGCVGGNHQAREKLEEAHGAFEQYVKIMRRLVEQDSSNAGWRDDLQNAYSSMCDALKAMGKTSEAEAMQRESEAMAKKPETRAGKSSAHSA